MRNLDLLRAQVHRRILDLRAVNRLLHSERCEAASRISDIPDFENPRDLKDWIEETLTGQFNHQSYRQLRDLAKNHNIPRWSRLDYGELVEALSEVFVRTSRESFQRHQAVSG